MITFFRKLIKIQDKECVIVYVLSMYKRIGGRNKYYGNEVFHPEQKHLFEALKFVSAHCKTLIKPLSKLDK